MSLAVTLGDIVKKGRDVECPAVLYGRENARREWMLLPELASFDRGEHSNGPDQMLVNSIVVIHVELHHRDDATELGDEAAENAGFIHPPERRFRVAARSQQAHKQGVGGRVGPHP